MRQRSPKLFPLLKRGNNLTKLGAPKIEADTPCLGRFLRVKKYNLSPLVLLIYRTYLL